SSYFGGTFADLLQAGFINHRPVTLTKNATVPAGAACTAGINVATIDNGSYDPDAGDVLTLSVNPAGPLGLGQHEVSLTSKDRYGASNSSTSIVTVDDRSAPVISGLAVDTPVLWPPNGHSRLVTVTYSAADNCGQVQVELLVSSSESEGGGKGNQAAESRIVDANHVLVAADRDRSYRIEVVATDEAGNASRSSIDVSVARQ